MFRTLLAYPLILAVALGPLLCCCTAGRALGAIGATEATNSPRPEAPATRTVNSAHPCCANKHQHNQKPAAPKPAKPDPTKPGQSCPCKDGSSKVQATQGTAAVDLTEHLRLAVLDLVTPEFGAEVLVSLADCDAAARDGPPASFPSTSDLLFSHHKLRC